MKTLQVKVGMSYGEQWLLLSLGPREVNNKPQRKKKVTPWETGDIQPALREVIESGLVDFPRQGRALIPGCGSVRLSVNFVSGRRS